MATAPRNTEEDDRQFFLTEVFSKASDLGGYTVYLLNWITWFLFGDDGFWSIEKTATTDEAGDIHAAFPCNSEEAAQAKEWARRPDVVAAYADDKGIVYVRIHGAPGWLSFAPRIGMKIFGMKKVVKRLRSLVRPAAMGARLSEIRIKYIDPMDFVERPDQLLSEARKYQRKCKKAGIKITLKEAIERIWDGAMVHTPEFQERVIAHSNFHRDPLRGRMQQARCKKAKALNTVLHTADGLFKGNSLRANPAACDGTWDIMIPRFGAKEEIVITDHVLIVMEPQGPKDKVVMDVQTFVNNEYLFPEDFMAKVVKDFFNKLRRDIENGSMIMDPDEMESDWLAQLKDHVADVGIMTAMKFSIMELLARGVDIRLSPYMLKQWANAKVNNLLRGTKVRVYMPCVIKAQKVSRSVAAAAGYDMPVEPGQVMWCEGLGVMVVADISMITEYENQGGDDQDDFHAWYQRTLNGEKVVIDIRNPNEMGQYSIYKYVEGDRVFTYTTVKDVDISFPEIEGPLPKQLFNCLVDSDVRYTGLPSDSMPKVKKAKGDYSLDDVDVQIDSTVGRGSPGGPINVSMLWALTKGKLRHEDVCAQEAKVDAYTQAELGAGDADTKAIEEHMERQLDELRGLPMDRKFVLTRFRSVKFRRQWGMTNLVEGRFTRLWNLVDAEIKDFRKWVDAYAQQHAQIMDPEIYDLGGFTVASQTPNHQVRNLDNWGKYQWALYQEAAGLLRPARVRIGQFNAVIRAEWRTLCDHIPGYREDHPEPRQLNDEEWEEVYAPIRNAFVVKATDHERMNLALAFLSASYKIRTSEQSGNRISDQLAWAAKQDKDGNYQGPFPFIMEALKFWGFIDLLVSKGDEGGIVNVGKKDAWTFECPSCHRELTSSDRKLMQRLFTVGQCKACVNNWR